MTIVQGTQDLSSELSSVLFSQFSVAYNVIEHLSAVDIFEEEVEMTLCDDDVSHSTNVWMPKQSDDCGLADCPNLSVFVFGSSASICPFRLAMGSFWG